MVQYCLHRIQRHERIDPYLSFFIPQTNVYHLEWNTETDCASNHCVMIACIANLSYIWCICENKQVFNSIEPRVLQRVLQALSRSLNLQICKLQHTIVPVCVTFIRSCLLKNEASSKGGSNGDLNRFWQRVWRESSKSSCCAAVQIYLLLLLVVFQHLHRHCRTWSPFSSTWTALFYIIFDFWCYIYINITSMFFCIAYVSACFWVWEVINYLGCVATGPNVHWRHDRLEYFRPYQLHTLWFRDELHGVQTVATTVLVCVY